jgi:transposase InsO family protein
MPWKVSSEMDERLRFIARLLEGEAMTDLCVEFGISRKTGYKIYDRYKQSGAEALNDRSRRPYRYANQLPPQVVAQIVGLKNDKPHWGARKIRELLLRRLPSEIKVPSRSTIHAVLDRSGLVKRMGRRRNKAHGTALSAGANPNDLWGVDFKGEFTLGNKRYCYPLTVTDHASRYLLMCEALESVREEGAFQAFEQLFRERGLPAAIRSDNGVPFASPNALFNLSKLAVWWLRLGISIERIKPGHPQQNGRHERMHRTLKEATTRPAAMNSLQQQAKFDAFITEYNTERPHEALIVNGRMKVPAELYQPSPRIYQGIGELEYPFHDRDITVTSCGRICMHRKKINLSIVLAGQKLGIKEVDEGIWLVSFMHYDLGYIDLEQKTLQPLDNPFGPGLSPMS